MSDTTYVNCARIIDATRNDPGNGDARETAIGIMVDLFAACKALLSEIESPARFAYKPEEMALIRQARAAIARAEGGAQ